MEHLWNLWQFSKENLGSIVSFWETMAWWGKKQSESTTVSSGIAGYAGSALVSP